MVPITITRLGLNKLFLWSETERLQTYAQALARAQTGKTYTRREIGERLFDLAYLQGSKPLRESVLANCFGLEQVANDKLVIRGINLFRSTHLPRQQPVTQLGLPPRYTSSEDLWMPTEAALAMGTSYRADPSSKNWMMTLAHQLACYEVRTRLMLHLLGPQGWSLQFVENGFFSLPSIEAKLTRSGEVIALFANDGAAYNQLLTEHVHTALGPWWMQELRCLGYRLAEDFVLQGATNRSPSTNMLNSAIKTALWVFYTLKVIVETAEGWAVNPDQAVAMLGEEISNELLGTEVRIANPLTALRRAANVQTDPLGYLVVSQLIEHWGTMLGIPHPEQENAFDRFMREKLYTEEVRILSHHPGQPRLGRGLLGDDGMRKIRLEIISTMKDEG